jgi:tetratricopeptide (TPR) repeat protein
MAMVLMLLGRSAEAVAEFEKAIRQDDSFVDSQYQMSKALLQLGRRRDALEHLQIAHTVQPTSTSVGNDLAWVLATAPEAELRNGKKALQLALQASKATGNKDPIILDTLAAAYAEAGDYSGAQTISRAALELARMGGNRELILGLEREIDCYNKSKPWRDGPMVQEAPTP